MGENDTGAARSRARFIGVRVAAVAAGWLAVELVAWALFWAHAGAPLSWEVESEQRRRAFADAGSFEVPRPADLDERQELIPHPYLGFIANPDLETFRTGDGPFDPAGGTPPRAADPARFVLGVFGGSVAQELAQSEQFREAIAALPELEGREVQIVVVATPAWKQPQQLYALSYLWLNGYHFDAILELDGYNEIGNAWGNHDAGIHPLYPYMQRHLMASFEGATYVGLVGEIAVRRRDRAARARWLEGSALRFSPTVSLLWRRWEETQRAAIADAQRELGRLRDDSHHTAQVGPQHSIPDPEVDPAPLYGLLGRVWRDSSIQMHALCRARGVPYLHLLQPNQYVPDSKQLTPDERAEAGSSEILGRIIPDGYPFLVREIPALRDAGVRFADLRMVFLEEPERVYRDWCCHVNELGNTILAGAVARELAPLLRP